MSRAKWKSPYVSELLIVIFNNSKKHVKNIFTKSRSSTIIPSFVGHNVKIYNGKMFTNVKITETMIGKKLGEFSPTRKNFSFKKKKNKI